MTNGEKFIELFPNLEITNYLSAVKAKEWKFVITADKEWWYSEYKNCKAESEE